MAKLVIMEVGEHQFFSLLLSLLANYLSHASLSVPLQDEHDDNGLLPAKGRVQH